MKPSKEEGERAWLFTQCERYDLAPSQMMELLALFESHDENSKRTAVLSPRHGIGKRILISLKLAATFAKSDNDARSAFEPTEVHSNDVHSGASLNLKPSNHENCACSKAKVPFVTNDGSANSDLDVDMETCARCCTTGNAHERTGSSKENNPNQPPIANDGDWDNQPTLSTGSPADIQEGRTTLWTNIGGRSCFGKVKSHLLVPRKSFDLSQVTWFSKGEGMSKRRKRYVLRGKAALSLRTPNQVNLYVENRDGTKSISTKFFMRECGANQNPTVID